MRVSNYIPYREKKEWGKKGKNGKNPSYKNEGNLHKWSYFKEKKNLRDCKKRVTQSAKLMNFFFPKTFSNSSLLVLLSL